MQIKKIFLLLLVSCFLSSCYNLYPSPEDDIPYLLGLETVSVDFTEFKNVALIGNKYLETATYQLSKNTLKEFEAIENKVLDRMKTKSWIAQDWASTPADSSSQTLYRTVLHLDSMQYQANLEELHEGHIPAYPVREFEETIENTYQKTGAYHAAYFNPSKENPQTIEFYILEIESRKLYIITYNYPVEEE